MTLQLLPSITPKVGFLSSLLDQLLHIYSQTLSSKTWFTKAHFVVSLPQKYKPLVLTIQNIKNIATNTCSAQTTKYTKAMHTAQRWYICNTIRLFLLIPLKVSTTALLTQRLLTVFPKQWKNMKPVVLLC